MGVGLGGAYNKTTFTKLLRLCYMLLCVNLLTGYLKFFQCPVKQLTLPIPQLARVCSDGCDRSLGIRSKGARLL